MMEKFAKLKAILKEVQCLSGAAAVLGWDQETYMPPGGIHDRSEQLATLSKLAHEKFANDTVGALLEALSGPAAALDPDSDDARLVRVCARQYRKAVKVPPDFVETFARVTSTAQNIWAKARGDNDFQAFRPSLERIVEMKRQYADFFQPYECPYDPLLDDYEPGMKTRRVKAIFDAVRPAQRALIDAIAARPQADDAFLRRRYGVKKQSRFTEEILTALGFDWKRGRQDISAHPFTTTFGLGDVRVTTRITENFLPSAIFGSIHECGHALYEQNAAPSLAFTPLASGASLGVHESQSRLWENIVGRSRDFWAFFYPKLRRLFPSRLADIDDETFYRGINRVAPSLVRVEADEASYNPHILLRFDLELALIEGSLSVRDLPERWRVLSKAYLSIAPETDREGVLQDIHWSMGAIGYFPTYALGNLMAAAFWETATRALPDLSANFRRGNFAPLREWATERLYRHGAKFEPDELITRITGAPLTGDPYVRYLREKYGDIYGLT